MSFATVFSSLFAVVLALIAVLALAALALKALRHWQDRFRQGAEGTGPQMRFLRAMPLGQNERAVLMEAQGEVLLVGVTTGGISLLARWPESEKTREEAPAGASAGGLSFPVTGADS